MPSPLFDQVVSLCGLSEIFAADAMERACARAGIDTQSLSPSQLAEAVPHMERAMKIFLGAEEAKRRARLILALRIQSNEGEA